MIPPDDEPPLGLRDRVMARSGAIFASIGLVAWIALLWFMFGDVL